MVRALNKWGDFGVAINVGKGGGGQNSNVKSILSHFTGPLTSQTGLYLTGGSGGFDPPQEVADPPQKVLQNLFGGSTLTPPKNLPIPFLAKPVYVQL